jgi:hypothetical protein
MVLVRSVHGVVSCESEARIVFVTLVSFRSPHQDSESVEILRGRK